MTTPAHDLSKLRINRDNPSPGMRRAFSRNLILAAIAIVGIVALFLFLRRGGAPVVQVAVASVMNSNAPAAPGAASVTANGYVVARTHASVSAKVPGRLAYLGVSEGSRVRAGEVIARLENDDFQAQVNQAEANLASAQAQQVEAESDRDQLAREAKRLSDIRTQ